MNDKYIELDFAKLDTQRQKRRGYSEAVFCECKENDDLLKIFQAFISQGQNILGTRATKEQFEFLKNKLNKEIL